MGLAGALMGFVGLFVDALACPAHVIACLRGVFGAIFLTAVLAWQGALPQVRLLKQNWKAGVLLGGSASATIFLYFLAVIHVRYAVAAFLLYTGPIFAVIFMRAFLHEQVDRWHYLAFGLALAGVALIMEPWRRLEWDVGLLYGVGSGLSLGVQTLSKKLVYRSLGSRLQTTYDHAPLVLAWWVTVALAVLFAIPSVIYLASAPFPNLWAALGLGLFPTAVAFTCFNYGLRQDEGGDVLILSYLEVLVATILTLALAQEISLASLLGGAAIVGANLLILLRKRPNILPFLDVVK